MLCVTYPEIAEAFQGDTTRIAQSLGRVLPICDPMVQNFGSEADTSRYGLLTLLVHSAMGSAGLRPVVRAVKLAQYHMLRGMTRRTSRC